jgi:2-oxoglutarate ferredoxin oxidoreductase subunit beta
VVGAKGRFFARTIDTNVTLSTQIYIEAARHKGTSVIEVLQNCVIFNDGIHEEVAGKEVRDDRTLILRHGEPMIFGKNNDKGLILEGLKLKVVKTGEGGVPFDKILVHDATEENPGIHYMLANMKYPEYPVALGVIRAVAGPTYEKALADQISTVQKSSKIRCMDDLLNSGPVWKVN